MSNDLIEIELSAMAHGGSALGRQGGRTVFVPYTLPGERIQARIVEDKGRVAFAEGVTLLEASADRVYPRCPHFGPGRCGRCQWQHIDYPAQLLLKQDVLADQLARIGGFDDADVRTVIPAPEIWNYNHHMTLRVENGVRGFPAADGRGIHAIDECHILQPDLLDLYNALDLDFDGLTRLTLQIGSDGAMMLIIGTTDDLAPELHTDLPASVNLLLSAGEPVNLIGEASTRYQVNGRTFRVTAGGTFHPNVAALGGLVNVVLDMLDLHGNETLLDLYGGVGLFTAFAAPHAGLVTLAEAFPPAATDVEVNLADVENVDILEGDALDALNSLEERYDVALLNPPPDGLGAEVVDGLAAADIPRLVYVSSDPAMLARDAKRLAQQGYTLGVVQPLDLAPQTYYIDAVALLTR